MEEWKIVPEYGGLIEASSTGKIRRWKKIRNEWVSHNLVLRTSKGGYNVVHIHIGKLDKEVKVHRLVAKAFIPNPANLPLINHKNEIKTDNNVENLEWCDCKYNTNYGTAIARRAKAASNDPNRSCPILQYTLNGELIQEFPSFKEAQRYLGKRYPNIWEACNSRKKTAYGYLWSYKYIEGKKIIQPQSYKWFEDEFGIPIADILEELDFNSANCVKYLLRAGRKQEEGMTALEKQIEDLEKARWYLNDKIETLKANAKILDTGIKTEGR